MRSLSGVITCGNRQTCGTFDAATRLELEQRGIEYRLIGVTYQRLRRPKRLALAFWQDLRCILSTWHADFLVLGAGTDYLQRPRLARILLAVARHHDVPTFVHWNICETILANLATRLGHSRFNRASRILARDEVQHLAISEYTADEVAETIGVERPQVILNSVPLPGEYDLQMVPEDPPIVLNVASVQHRKGPDLFIDVAAKVVERHPSTRFVWVGGTATPELQARIDAHGLNENVEFLGTVFPPFEWMQRASGFLLTSRTEAAGRVVAEAMACYRTVCCFEGTGAAEWVGEAGLTSPKFDLERMAQHIVRILERPAEHRVNIRARQKYEERFSPKRFSDTLAPLLRGGVSSGGSSVAAVPRGAQ